MIHAADLPTTCESHATKLRPGDRKFVILFYGDHFRNRETCDRDGKSPNCARIPNSEDDTWLKFFLVGEIHISHRPIVAPQVTSQSACGVFYWAICIFIPAMLVRRGAFQGEEVPHFGLSWCVACGSQVGRMFAGGSHVGRRLVAG